MNRWLPILLLVCAASAQAPLPKPASFAWDVPVKTDRVDTIIPEWPGGAQLFEPWETNYTVPDFPLGVANPVSVYSQSNSGVMSPTNTIYVLNLRAVFEEADYPEGPYTAGPEARVLVERHNPKGFFRVRLEIQ